LFRSIGDANLDLTVAQARLRSSFIYLANAVNDLSGDWTVFALVLAPLVLAASLCLLPDALNIQHRVANSFESADTHAVSVMLHRLARHEVQAPYHPETTTPAPIDPYPEWMTLSLHLLFPLILLMVMLVVLCGLARRYAQARAPTAMAEAVAIYRRALQVGPAFFWISFLQLLVNLAACAIFMIPLMLLHILFFGTIAIDPYIKIPLLIPGLLVVIVLHFSKVALVFDGIRSWHALLHSREIERGRFLKVAVRIIVFYAMLSWYNSWASGAFLVASILLGPVAAATGYVWGIVFVLDLLSVAVAYFTIAFFVAASVRLYQDLTAEQRQRAEVTSDALPATAPLPSAASAS
jgi:hypothetical protein